MRNQNLAILAERNDLQVYLRQCIDDVRRQIEKDRRFDCNTLNKFTIKERNRSIELLLSKERVLNILYTHMKARVHPDGAKADQTQKLAHLKFTESETRDSETK